MRVDDVGLPFAADAQALEKSVDDIGDGKQLQPRLGSHFARGAFFVREDFPVCGCITEAVDVRSVDVVALESFIGGGEYLNFDARFFQVSNGSAQPRDFGIFLESRVNRAYDEDFHCSCFGASV